MSAPGWLTLAAAVWLLLAQRRTIARQRRRIGRLQGIVARQRRNAAVLVGRLGRLETGGSVSLLPDTDAAAERLIAETERHLFERGRGSL